MFSRRVDFEPFARLFPRRLFPQGRGPRYNGVIANTHRQKTPRLIHALLLWSLSCSHPPLWSLFAMTAKRVNLFYTNPEENSDKRFDIILEESLDGAGWVVNTLNGKRLGTMTARTLTPAPVDLAKAQKLFDAKLNSKLKEGYSADESGAVYQSVDFKDRVTGLAPHLLTEIDQEDLVAVEAVLSGPQWMIQEKMDGERLMLQKFAATQEAPARVVGNNKKGLKIPVPVGIEKAVLALACESCVIDCEWLHESAAPFDLLEINGEDLRGVPAKARKERLDTLIHKDCVAPWIFIRTAHTEADKRALFAEVKARDGEGVAGKQADSEYKAGKAGKSATQVKIKFFRDATFEVVAKHPSKRSVSIATYDGEKQIKVGNLTIPENKPIPEVGSFLDAYYAYAFAGGSLFHAHLKEFRTDQTRADCRYSDIVIKPGMPLPKELAKELAEFDQEVAQSADAGVLDAALAQKAPAKKARRAAP